MSSTVADPLEANVIALPHEHGVVIVVGVDALFGSTELRTLVLQELRSEIAERIVELVFVASHTHHTPSLDPQKPRLGTVDQAHLSIVSERIAKSIETAILATRTSNTVEIERGTSHCALTIVRRKSAVQLSPRRPFVTNGMRMLPNHRAEAHTEIDVVVASVAGKPIWAIWRWTCHATSFYDENQVSADFPGQVRKRIRSELGDESLPVVYLPGFAGDHRSNVRISKPDLKARFLTPFAQPFCPATKESFETLCQEVSDRTAEALANTSPNGTLAEAKVSRTSIGFNEMMDTPRTGEVAMTLIDCGPLSLFLMGAETCSPYVGILAPLLPPGTLLSGYANDVPLYLPSDTQIAEGGYEVDGFRDSFDLPGKYFPKIEALVAAKVASLTEH
jgi:hypothetical protein